MIENRKFASENRRLRRTEPAAVTDEHAARSHGSREAHESAEKQEAAVTYKFVPRWRQQRLLWVMTTRGRPRWGGGSILNLTRGFARSKPFANTPSPPPLSLSPLAQLGNTMHFVYMGLCGLIRTYLRVFVCSCE